MGMTMPSDESQNTPRAEGLYRITIDGETCEWGGIDSLPWHDVNQVVGGAVMHGADRIAIEQVGDD